MKKVNGRTGKGQHQVKGVKVVTSRRFAEVNGIAVGLYLTQTHQTEE
ncbi:MAG: hypothetical protein ACLTS6_11495 [Anaerobutyricum sp.]